MKPSTAAKLITFFALYEAALAAPQGHGGAGAIVRRSEASSSSSAYEGNPSSLYGTRTSSSSGTQPTHNGLTSGLDGDEYSRYTSGDELSRFATDDDSLLSDGSESNLCRHGRIFNVQQACVDHCVSGVCYDSMWTPPIDYTAYEYTAGPNTNTTSSRPGNDNSKRDTSGSPRRQGSGPEITQYQMQVTKQQMQIWVCAACPSAQQSPILKQVAHTSTVQPITTSATTSVSGRTAATSSSSHHGGTTTSSSSHRGDPTSSSSSQHGGETTTSSSHRGDPTSSSSSY